MRPRRAIFPSLLLATTLLLSASYLAACARQTDTATSPTLGTDVQQSGTSEPGAAGSVTENAKVADIAEQDGASSSAFDRLVVRNLSMQLKVDDVQATAGKIQAIATRLGGSLTDMQLSTTDQVPVYRQQSDGAVSGALQGYLTIRVPVDRVTTAASEIRRLGDVQQESEASDDVTQQHIDLKARVANLRVEEGRLREFFASATKVSDMLAIEQELSRVRGEIESLDAQVAFLERQAAMATITVQLVEPTPLVSPQSDGWGFGQAITDGIRGAAGVLRSILTALIAASPLFVLGIAVFLIVRTRLRKRSARDATSQEEA